MLNPAKASPTALLNTAKNFFDKKKYAEAEQYLHEILRRDINDPAGLALLAEIYVARDKVNDAVAFYMAAIRSNPSELLYKERFIELGGRAKITGYEELMEQTLVECLKSADRLDVSRMQPLWSVHIASHPEFEAAYGLLKRKNYDPANREFFESLSNFKPLFRPCFLLGLRHLSALTPVFEEFITHIRRHLLEDYCGEQEKFTPDERLALASAFAHLSFREDYILNCTEDEQKKTDVLRTKIESGAADAAGVAIYACYAPLYTLKNAAEVAQRFSAAPGLADVVRAQVTDVEALRATAAGITAITPIDDAVSVKVREQYEEFPYPQWQYFSAAGLLRHWETCGRNEEIERSLRRKKAKMLIAGCGTGQEAAVFATIFPDADILAVDLSRTSLAYAINKAAEFKITNVTFRQADILRLGDVLGQEEFDYISASGVLHHMEDPVRGWKVLCSLLKPGGVMQVCLYSKAARWAVTEARGVIQQGGHASDRASMKAFRRDSLKLLRRPVLDTISGFTDYYYMGMYRDLLFHVQEHCYGLPEIRRILEELKLELVSFLAPASVMAEYGQRFPDDPAKTDFDNWHRFEEESPAIFRSMYAFWCRKGKS